MSKYTIWLSPDRVAALQARARRVAFETDAETTWADLVRQGVDLMLANHSSPKGDTTQFEARKK